MLYEALAQPSIFLWMVAGGFVSGLLFDLRNILLQVFKKNQIIAQISLFFAVFLTFGIFFLFNLKTNYGDIRFFPILAFALAFALERFFVQNFVAKPAAKCYNALKGKINERRTRKAKNKVENSQN